MKTQKNIILFMGGVPSDAYTSVKHLEKVLGYRLRIGLIRNVKKNSKKEAEDVNPNIDVVISADFSSTRQLIKAIKPYRSEILATTCRKEARIPLFSNLVPLLPYVKMPTERSLIWSTDKIAMREVLAATDKKITPRFMVVKSANKKTLTEIKDTLTFPVVLKPSGLAQSILVSVCFHKEELEKNLNTMFRKIRKVYADRKQTSVTPKVLVEEFMEGDMYSIDGYVNGAGKIYHCPMVFVKTGRDIGFDDFFNYKQMSPTVLKPASIADAHKVVEKAVHGIGLRSTTFHLELMRTEDGWKVIEIGPRVGGFRHIMHSYTHGIDHGMNDILVRVGKKPILPKRRRGYATAMKFFAKKEGWLTELKGIKKIQELPSLKWLKVNKKIGDRCTFAKNGGVSVCNMILFNKDRSKLLEDVRKVEQTLSIKTE